MANGKWKTSPEDEASVFLCKTEPWIARPRSRPEDSFQKKFKIARHAEPLKKLDYEQPLFFLIVHRGWSKKNGEA